MRPLALSLRPFAAVALAAVFALSGAHAQTPNFARGKQLWLASRYAQAMPPLKLHRREPSGRNAEVDYMLGTSGCRVPREREWGANVLNFALNNYPLTAASRATISAEHDRCRAAGAVGPLSAASRGAVDMAVVAGASARGKLFNSGDRGVAAYPARRTRPLVRAELDRRIVPLGRPERITAALRPLAPDARVLVVGRYAFVTQSNQSDDELRRMAAQLERYVMFLSREYGIALPPQYITLYLMPDIGSIQALADRVHGLDVSPSTLGYSFQDDLSAVGMIRGTQSGTLMHELFHLLVRASFGDIPQWLDEGVASLYEVSREQGDRYVGLPNWRGRVLRNALEERPSIADVVASPWFAFDGVGRDSDRFMISTERDAVHLATARYLALYLQDRGVLRQVFAAFRQRDPGATNNPGRAGVAIVEQAIGGATAAEPAFAAWLGDAVQRDDTFSPDTPGKTLPLDR